jgi:hypothetical protein
MQSRSRLTRRSILGGSLSLLFAGCSGAGGGGSSGPNSFADEPGLSELASLFRAFTKMNKRPPKNFNEIASLEQGYPTAIRKLRSGELVVQWGAPLSSQDNASTTVLAYNKEVPEQGGNVLMQDGTTVQKMSAEEFKAAPKATGG